MFSGDLVQDPGQIMAEFYPSYVTYFVFGEGFN